MPVSDSISPQIRQAVLQEYHERNMELHEAKLTALYMKRIAIDYLKLERLRARKKLSHALCDHLCADYEEKELKRETIELIESEIERIDLILAEVQQPKPVVSDGIEMPNPLDIKAYFESNEDVTITSQQEAFTQALMQALETTTSDSQTKSMTDRLELLVSNFRSEWQPGDTADSARSSSRSAYFIQATKVKKLLEEQLKNDTLSSRTSLIAEIEKLKSLSKNSHKWGKDVVEEIAYLNKYLIKYAARLSDKHVHSLGFKNACERCYLEAKNKSEAAEHEALQKYHCFPELPPEDLFEKNLIVMRNYLHNSNGLIELPAAFGELCEVKLETAEFEGYLKDVFTKGKDKTVQNGWDMVLKVLDQRGINGTGLLPCMVALTATPFALLFMFMGVLPFMVGGIALGTIFALGIVGVIAEYLLFDRPKALKKFDTAQLKVEHLADAASTLTLSDTLKDSYATEHEKWTHSQKAVKKLTAASSAVQPSAPHLEPAYPPQPPATEVSSRPVPTDDPQHSAAESINPERKQPFLAASPPDSITAIPETNPSNKLNLGQESPGSDTTNSPSGSR